MAKISLISSNTPRRLRCWALGWIFSISLLFVAVVITIMFLFLAVLPRTHVLNFQIGNCTGVEVTRLHGDHSCSCGRYCTSFYPCVQVYTVYTTQNGDKHGPTMLHKDQDDLNNEQCSIEPEPCSANYHSNEHVVDTFARLHGKNSKYKCFYNPSDTSEVITLRDADYVPWLLWPGLVCLVFAVLTAITCKPCMEARRVTKELNQRGVAPAPQMSGSTNTGFTTDNTYNTPYSIPHKTPYNQYSGC